MEKFLTVVVSGGVNGLVYALIGLAFILIFRVDRTVNLALGECVAVGALVAYELSANQGTNLVLTGVAVVGVGAMIGMVTEVGILRRMRTRDPLRVLILSFGLALVLQSILKIVWGTDLYSLPTFPAVPEVIRVGYQRAVLPGQGVWIIALAVTVFVVWALVLARTSLGRDLRAVSNDREVAEAMGINASRRVAGAYVVGCAIAALVGFVVSPVIFMSYQGGTLLGLKGLIAALVGGFQRPLGPLVGGLILGLGEAATAGYYQADWKEVTVFTLLIAILLVRPQGVLPNTAEAA